MKALVWNCQGLGNAPAVRALLDVQRRTDPDVVFLSETHLERYPAECLKRRLKMDGMIVNPSDGREGGVVLYWKKGIEVVQLFSDPNYIDVRIDDNVGPWKVDRHVWGI